MPSIRPGAPSTSVAAATEPQYNWFCQNLNINASTSAIQLDNMSDQFTKTTVDPINQFYYAAYPLQIRWKEGDFAAAKTTLASLSSATSTSPVPAQSVASGRPTSTSPAVTAYQSSNSLSTGAIAAIAVVVGIVLLCALGVLVWWLRRRYRGQYSASTKSTASTKSKDGYASGITEDPYASNRTHEELEAPGAREAAELEARERAELETRERAELEARKRVSRAEMG